MGLMRLMVVTMVEPLPLDGPVERSDLADRDVPTLRSFEGFCAAESERLAKALATTLNNRELGREAADEALARAWPRWAEVSEYDNPAGWVYRVGLDSERELEDQSSPGRRFVSRSGSPLYPGG